MGTQNIHQFKVQHKKERVVVRLKYGSGSYYCQMIRDAIHKLLEGKRATLFYDYQLFEVRDICSGLGIEIEWRNLEGIYEVFLKKIIIQEERKEHMEKVAKKMKASEELHAKIYQEWANDKGLTQKELGIKYGLSQYQINMIIKKEHEKQVSEWRNKKRRKTKSTKSTVIVERK